MCDFGKPIFTPFFFFLSDVCSVSFLKAALYHELRWSQELYKWERLWSESSGLPEPMKMFLFNIEMSADFMFLPATPFSKSNGNRLQVSFFYFIISFKKLKQRYSACSLIFLTQGNMFSQVLRQYCRENVLGVCLSLCLFICVSFFVFIVKWYKHYPFLQEPQMQYDF